MSRRAHESGASILVAGGAGFIGSNLCASLVGRGCSVICMDNLVTGRMVNLVGLLGNPLFDFVEHDITSPIPDLGAVSQIYHLASPASPPGYQRFPIETLRVNSEGTRFLLEFALRRGARLLYASTSEAYGDPLEHPQRETYRGNVSSTGPRSMYDEGKRYGEALTMAAVRTLGADARIVRIFNTYGPNSDPLDGRLVPNFVTQALTNQPLTVYGDGQQTRSLCYVSDLIDGLQRAMECEGTSGTVLNLGNPEEHTVWQLAELIVRLAGTGAPIALSEGGVGDDPQRRCPDISLATRRLGWQPLVALDQGLLKTIAYFREALQIPADGRIGAEQTAIAGVHRR
jgi:UDP-glucuronate decarboxylase